MIPDAWADLKLDPPSGSSIYTMGLLEAGYFLDPPGRLGSCWLLHHDTAGDPEACDGGMSGQSTDLSSHL